MENHCLLNNFISSAFFSNKPEQTVLPAPEKMGPFKVGLFPPIWHQVPVRARQKPLQPLLFSRALPHSNQHWAKASLLLDSLSGPSGLGQEPCRGHSPRVSWRWLHSFEGQEGLIIWMRPGYAIWSQGRAQMHLGLGVCVCIHSSTGHDMLDKMAETEAG